MEIQDPSFKSSWVSRRWNCKALKQAWGPFEPGIPCQHVGYMSMKPALYRASEILEKVQFHRKMKELYSNQISLDQFLVLHSISLIAERDRGSISSSVKKSYQMRRCGFDPWLGKIPWRRKLQPIPVVLPGEFHGQRSLAGYSPWGCKSQTRLSE